MTQEGRARLNHSMIICTYINSQRCLSQKQQTENLQTSPRISDKHPRHIYFQFLTNSSKNRKGGTLLNSSREAGITFTLDPARDSLRGEIGGQTHTRHTEPGIRSRMSANRCLQETTREVHKMPRLIWTHPRNTNVMSLQRGRS